MPSVGWNVYNLTSYVVRLISSLNAVQAKLSQLEQENGISRRRVGELELELERCKSEVVRERTRVMERDSSLNAVPERQRADQASHPEHRRQQRGTGERVQDGGSIGARKGKHVRLAIDEEGFGDLRYREVVEEKKGMYLVSFLISRRLLMNSIALEALTSTLRNHLARLTSELASHQQLLVDLRLAQQEHVRDRRAIKAQLGDVERLKSEVERLSGEVEVLRSVVEEGLRERRRDGRGDDYSGDGTVPDGSYIPDDGQGDEHDNTENGVSYTPLTDLVVDDSEDDDTASMPMSIATPSPSPSVQLPHIADKTSRTDAATMASNSNPVVSRPYINPDELEQISGDISARRSERIERSASRTNSARSSRRNSPNNSLSHKGSVLRPPSPLSMADVRSPSPVARPAAPTPAHAARQAGPPQQSDPTERNAAPYPKIRDPRAKKLFFSAPVHDEKTCTVCNRPSRPAARDGHLPSWLRTKRMARDGHNNDVFNPQDVPDIQDVHLPPQTVLARVLRELEDDFTHYKG
jgi:hypothetical protein